jgi:hypothetical protein
MLNREQLIERLNSIEWLEPESITPEAQRIIDDHLSKIRIVIRYIMEKQSIDAVEAHGFAQTAGHDSPEVAPLLDDLFSKVTFRGAGARWSIIATIAAAYGWKHDPDLRDFPNPWSPLLDLIDMGYTISLEDDPDGKNVSLLIFYKNSDVCYDIFLVL